jgi:hypothetical protein
MPNFIISPPGLSSFFERVDDFTRKWESENGEVGPRPAQDRQLLLFGEHVMNGRRGAAVDKICALDNISEGRPNMGFGRRKPMTCQPP